MKQAQNKLDLNNKILFVFNIRLLFLMQLISPQLLIIFLLRNKYKKATLIFLGFEKWCHLIINRSTFGFFQYLFKVMSHNLRSRILPSLARSYNHIPEIIRDNSEALINQFPDPHRPSLPNNIEKKQQKMQKRYLNVELEARDKEVIIELDEPNKEIIDESTLDQWITEVAQVVCSSAFRSYFSGQMTFEQAKIYCSENIMKNLINLSRTHEISPQKFRRIDETLQKKALRYVSKKYPLKESISVSRKFQKIVQQIDKSQLIGNNQIANNKIDFQYRQTGNYNDLIMKMINTLIIKINPPENGQDHYQRNLYTKFQELMTHIFEKVEDQDWINSSQFCNLEIQKLVEQIKAVQVSDVIKPGNSKSKIQMQRQKAKLQQKQRYKINVRQYSQSHFGRKIPQSEPPFSQKQIQTGQLIIKHPSILRILTKWCQELWQQFETPNYYHNRSLNLFLQNICEVRCLYPWFREHLNDQLAIQKENIENDLQNLQKETILMKVNILQREKQLNKEKRYLNELDQITGKFSIHMNNNLHHQIIAQLNRLIHGLMNVSDRLFRKHLDKDNYVIQLPYPPNLVTFKIGDILRCKFTSKEKEVIAIYNQLQKISKKNPEILNIVRIKNRLKNSTNDILINVRFHNAILCQIQLAINSKTSEFIKCSNTFQHFIYELQRSRFGPLSELCSIRILYDDRKEIYQQIIQKERGKPLSHSCRQNYKFISNFSPFSCYQCNDIHYSSKYAISHIKCNKCDYSICSKCHVKTFNKEKLVRWIIKGQQKYQKQIQKLITSQDQLKDIDERYGFLIPYQSRHIQIVLFRVIEYNHILYFIGIKKDGTLYQITQLQSLSQKTEFLKSNIVVLLDQNVIKDKLKQKQKKKQKLQTLFIHSTIDIIKAKKKCIYATAIKQRYKKQKQTLQIQQMQLNAQQCKKMLDLGTQTQKKAISILDLTQNQIHKIPFQPQEFPNLQVLHLSRNPLIQVKDFSKLNKLTTIYFDKCGLQEIPKFLFGMKNLQKLSFYKNPIQIIPDDIQRLQNLKQLNFENSYIKTISPKIQKCTQLQILSIQGNQLTQIPDTICNLNKLRCLHLFNNRISKLPNAIGNLKNLIQLRVQNNVDLKVLPYSIKELIKLKLINISLTNISDIDGLTNLKMMQSLTICTSKVQCLPINFSNLNNLIFLKLKGIKNCDLQNQPEKKNNLEKLIVKKCDMLLLPPSFANFSLKKIVLKGNKLHSINKQSFLGFKSLKTINLSQNNLVEFPNLLDCSKLNQIIMIDNHITSIPELKQLGQLRILDISFNMIAWINDSLLSLNKIETVNLSYNKIKNIISHQSQEEKTWRIPQLLLRNNYLDSIPPQIFKCQKLVSLDLSLNPFYSVNQFEKLSYVKKLIINDDQIGKKPSQWKKLTQHTKNTYLFTPKITDPSCHLCKIKLKLPFYWLKWENNQKEQLQYEYENAWNPKFGCRNCIQSASDLPKHHYKYQKNSILLFSDKRKLFKKNLVGQNLQPQINSNMSPHSSTDCQHCLKASPKLGIARYICLECNYPEDQKDKDFVDLCQNCLKKYIEKDYEDIEEDLPENHHKDHSWLRVLYAGKDYFVY